MIEAHGAAKRAAPEPAGQAATRRAGQNAVVDVVQQRVAELVNSAKARWLLAWLAAEPDTPGHADPFDAVDIPPRRTRLHTLRADPTSLLATAHNRVGDWRRNTAAHVVVETLVPRSGYQRAAAALVECSAARWWWQPLPRDSQSWICVDPDVHSAVGLPFATSYGHHWDATAPAWERMTASAATCRTSTRLPRLPAVQLLSDPIWPLELRPSPEHIRAWAVPVTDNARVYEIQGPADWIALVDRYPSHRTNLCQAPHLERLWPAGELIWTPEWREVAQDFDGVHLSPAGWLTATSQILEVPGRGLTICEGWVTESTAWFRPSFERFQQIEHDRLTFGYGRPETGSDVDLTTPPPRRPWWRRLVSRHRPV